MWIKDAAVVRSNKVKLAMALMLGAAVLSGCAKDHDLDRSGGVAIERSSCPAVAVAGGTGDVTLFNPADSLDSRAIDVVANITNLRVTCNDKLAGDIQSSVQFDVQARRTDRSGARDVVLPYYAVVVQGGKYVITKRINRVTLHFDAGQLRTSTSATAGASIDRAAATIPLEILNKLKKKRKSGDEDAAIDPLSDPAVRDKVNAANFELLIGFQLTDAQLKYNATR